MNFLFPEGNSSKDQTQSRLLLLVTVFLVLYSVILSLSPAVRLHSWQVEYRWQHWIGVAVWLGGFSFIHRQTLKYLPDRDAYIVPLIGMLAGLGLLTVWRLDNTFGLRQTIWVTLGALIFGGIVGRSNTLLLLRRFKYLWLTGGLLLTGLTFIFGTYPGGNRSASLVGLLRSLSATIRTAETAPDYLSRSISGRPLFNKFWADVFAFTHPYNGWHCPGDFGRSA